jgi:hypothetical protein
MAPTVTRLESFGSLSVGTPKPLVYAAPVDIIALWMRIRLSTTARHL